MQRTLILTLFLQLSVGALGTGCSAGYKAKASLTGAFCSTATANAASCNSNCCEADTTTCGGALVTATSTVLKCPFDSYHATDDAWKKTAAFTTKPDLTATGADLEALKNTWKGKCCVKKATCGAAPACPGGWKAKASVSAVMCSTDAGSCKDVSDVAQTATCCELNTATCGGKVIKDGGAAASTLASRTTLVNAAAGAWECGNTPAQYVVDTWSTDASFRKRAFTGVTGDKFKDKCCSTFATCASTHYSCPAGKVRSTDKTTKCTGNAATCASVAACCKKNGCGAYEAGAPAGQLKGSDAAAGCTTGYYAGSGTSGDAYWKNKAIPEATPTTANLLAVCCTAKATCKSAVCPSGYKKKTTTGVDALTCPTGAASCNVVTGANAAPCCEVDKTKCGGLTGISCAYGTYDERLYWVTTGAKAKQTPQATRDAWNNKPATDATKNTACCTAKAVCTGTLATTTPAATATPATAIRRYSEHKVAAQDPWSANMVWLGVGGMIGMSVVMAVQGLRSRMQAASAETDNLLDDTSSE